MPTRGTFEVHKRGSLEALAFDRHLIVNVLSLPKPPVHMPTEDLLSENILSSEEATARSAALKADGNQLFSQKRYEDAVKVYSEAIAVDNRNAVLYCNRSASFFALHAYVLGTLSHRTHCEGDPSGLAACQDALKAGRTVRSCPPSLSSTCTCCLGIRT